MTAIRCSLLGSLVPAVAVAVSIGTPVAAGAQASKPISLTQALNRLARQTGIELLFDGRVTKGKSAGPDRGASTPEARLRALLSGTGLTLRRTAGGSYFVTVAPQEAVAEPDPPVAEILVIGRRTVNADVRRSQQDVQPYVVYGTANIERSQSGTVEDFLRNRAPQNSQAMLLSQQPRLGGASVRSQVDLRGLGTSQTLVLLNGRRLPSSPGIGDFLQPDISAMPVFGIDRIEILGSTAAGIFGIGANGGSVNVVTKNEFDGVDATVRTGLSQHGDAGQRTISAHLGYTSPDGRTRFSVRIGGSQDDGLTFGDRSIIQTARNLRITRDAPGLYLPASSSINIQGPASQPLRLIPSLGGTTLAGSTTFLPVDAPALNAGGAAILVANAGRIDQSLAPDGQGTLQSLLTPSKFTSIMATLRQDVGSRIALFADYLRFRSEGSAIGAGVDTSGTTLLPGQGGNPFQQPIIITYPTPGIVGHIRNVATTDRLTVGAIVNLGSGWSLSLDGATGRAVVVGEIDRAPLTAASVNVFSGSAAIYGQLAAAGVSRRHGSYAVNRLRDANLKIAGSPLRLPGGPVSVTLTAEAREERAPGEVDDTAAVGSRPATTYSYARQRIAVASAFAEARVPIFGPGNHVPLFTGLDLQLAARYDDYSITVPVPATTLIASGVLDQEVTARDGVVAITAGVRWTPMRGLMLRGSFANGSTPPTPLQIAPNGFTSVASILTDPKRGGQRPVIGNQVVFLFGGSPTLSPNRAQTWSFGTVVEPTFIPGLRASIDYSILQTSREIADYAQGDFQYFLDRETLYPGRIVRAPLTAEDSAAGYTGGRILSVDASFLADGRTTVRTLDVAIDYALTTVAGAFQIYGRGTWEPEFRRRGIPDFPSYSTVNSANGPLALRANLGVDWQRKRLGAGFNARIEGASDVTYSYQQGTSTAAAFSAVNMDRLIEQGAERIPGQVYIDGYVGFRAGRMGEGRIPGTLDFRFGVRDLFNARPPIVVPPLSLSSDELGYSSYGDPRGRQFVLDVTARF